MPYGSTAGIQAHGRVACLLEGLYTGCHESKPRLAPIKRTSTFAVIAQKGKKDSLTF